MSLPIKAEHFEIAKQLTEVEKRNHSFWKTLSYFFEKLNFQRSDKKLRILNLACGICEEARTVCAFFSTGVYGMPARNAELIGVDNDELAIHKAKMLSRQPGILENQSFLIAANCRFMVGDVTQLNTVAGLPDRADIIILRHQFLLADMLENKDGWKKIISQAINRLDDGGYLLLTSFTEHERELLEKELSSLEVNVLISAKNPFSLPYPGRSDVFFDQSVTIAQKK